MQPSRGGGLPGSTLGRPNLDCVCLHHKSDMEQQDKRRKREALTYAGCFPLSRGGASGEVRLMIAGVASEGACEGASCLHQSLRLKCLSTGNQGKHSIACECGQHMHSATSEHIVRARRVMPCVCSAGLPTLASLARFGLFGHSLGLLGHLVNFGHNVAVWTDWEVPFLAFRRNAPYQGEFFQGPEQRIFDSGPSPVARRMLSSV